MTLQRAEVIAERRSQGLPATVSAPVVIGQIAGLIADMPAQRVTPEKKNRHGLDTVAIAKEGRHAAVPARSTRPSS